MVVIKLMLVSGVGWIFYSMSRAMGQVEMALLIKLASYCIAAVFLVEMVMSVATWFASLPVINIFFK